jgi:hypothetical protein
MGSGQGNFAAFKTYYSTNFVGPNPVGYMSLYLRMSATETILRPMMSWGPDLGNVLGEGMDPTAATFRAQAAIMYDKSPYATFLRMDAGTFSIRFTASGDRYGPPAGIIPLSIDLTSRVTTFGANLNVTGNVNVTGGYLVNGSPLTTGGTQSPWESHINAFGYELRNVARVGIGTTAPLTPLDVVVPSQAASVTATGTGGFRLATNTVASAISMFMGVHDPDYAWIQTVYPTQRFLGLALQPEGGAVSVGTTDPGTSILRVTRSSNGANDHTLLVENTSSIAQVEHGVLRVQGTTGTTGLNKLIVASSAVGDAFVVTSSGWVGIGITDPQYSLDVVGDIRYFGALHGWNGDEVISGSGQFVSGSGISTLGACIASAYSSIDSGGTIKHGYNGYVAAWGTGDQLLVVNGIVVGA